MVYATYTSDDDLTPIVRLRSHRRGFARSLFAPATLIAGIAAGSALLYSHLDSAPSTPVQTALRDRAPAQKQAAPPAVPVGTLAPMIAPSPVAASNPYGALFDPGYTSSAELVPLDQSAPLRSGFVSVAPTPAPVTTAAVPEDDDTSEQAVLPKVADAIPLPAPRPQDLTPLSSSPPRIPERQLAQQNRNDGAPVAPSDNRSFFDKVFGMVQPSGQVLAYASPEDGAVRATQNSALRPSISSGPASSAYDRYTAVYDISARVVYLPSGKRLEAHSGLGDRLDDPRFVSERMRGATPPHLYDLTLRETLFHGVQALRLNPIGDGALYGRTGLLAHRYMLGPNGDSNGCVSIKDYDAFLQAYRNGEIKRLVVVARMN